MQEKVPTSICYYQYEAVAFLSHALHIQYDDGRPLRCLPCLLHYNVLSLCRGFVTTELVSLQEEESARTLGVLDIMRTHTFSLLSAVKSIHRGQFYHGSRDRDRNAHAYRDIVMYVQYRSVCYSH